MQFFNKIIISCSCKGFLAHLFKKEEERHGRVLVNERLCVRHREYRKREREGE